MQIICISRGSYSQGKQLAEILAEKLGCACLSREDLVEEAVKEGIAVGKLATAMLKPGMFDERLLLEKEHFHAFATSYLCDTALRTNLVYHGRTGHLLLPGIAHVLRIRVVESLEERIVSAMNKMSISYSKAQRYITEVDDDMRRWVRTFYGVDWDTAANYDLVLNLEQMNSANAASMLCSVAELPDFQTTPASRRAMENLHLAAKVRLALARDKCTCRHSFKVVSESGAVLVTYPPAAMKVAECVPNVVGDVPGVAELQCTAASTSILWVAEEFDPRGESYEQVLSLAKRWNSAVELLRFVAGDQANSPPASPVVELQPLIPPRREYDGGIEDDVEAPPDMDVGNVREMYDHLAREGVAGAVRFANCPPNRLPDRLDSRIKYALVIVGNVFQSRGHAAQLRMSRELTSTLSEAMKVPVVGGDELKKTYMFTPILGVKLALYLVCVVGFLYLVFTNQDTVIELLHGNGSRTTLLRIAVTVSVALIVPFFAFMYGSITKYMLKLIKIE